MDSKTTNEDTSIPDLIPFTWDPDIPEAFNITTLGQILANSLNVYRTRCNRHLVVPTDNGGFRVYTTPDELSALLTDNLDITVLKAGNVKSRSLQTNKLKCLLKSHRFLECFKVVDIVTSQPLLSNDRKSFIEPGYTPEPEGHNILYLGPGVETRDNLNYTNAFLDKIGFSSRKDRHKAMAAKLVVVLRQIFKYGKPAIVVTTRRADSGEDDLLDFLSGSVPGVRPSIKQSESSLINNFVETNQQYPGAAILNLGNFGLPEKSKSVRKFLEKPFNTSKAKSPKNNNSPLLYRNDPVVFFSLTEGRLPEDILDQCLVINLSPIKEEQKDSEVFEVSSEIARDHIKQIDAEFYGMIKRWMDTGCPEGSITKRSWPDCSRIVSGILGCNDIACDLMSEQPTGQDQKKDAIARIGATILRRTGNGNTISARGLVGIVEELGLVETVCNGATPDSGKIVALYLGRLLSSYRDEMFVHTDDEGTVRFRLRKSGKRERVEGDNPVATYSFEKVVTDTADPLDENPDECEKEVDQEQIEEDCLLAV